MIAVVYEDFAISYLDGVSRQPDHPLHKVLAGVPGEVEYDDLPPLGRMNCEPAVGPVHLPEGDDAGQTDHVQLEIDQLVDHQVLAAFQGWVHAGAVDLEVPDAGLDDHKYD